MGPGMSPDENPYAAPRTAPDAFTPQTQMPPRDLRFWLRFVAALGVMAIANMAPLYFTWPAYGTDGYEVIGWPWVFRKCGGFEGGYYLYPDCFLGDVLIALGVAY